MILLNKDIPDQGGKRCCFFFFFNLTENYKTEVNWMINLNIYISLISYFIGIGLAKN